MFRHLEKYQLCTVPFCFRIQNPQSYSPGLATFTQIYVRNMLSVNPHAVNVLPDTTKTPKQNPSFKVQFKKLWAQYREKVSSFFFIIIFTEIQYCLELHLNHCLSYHSASWLIFFLEKSFSNIRDKMVNYTIESKPETNTLSNTTYALHSNKLFGLKQKDSIPF